MSDLAKQKCVPCAGGVPPLKGAALAEFAERLDGDWRVVDEHHLEKEFVFPDFCRALDFTVQIGQLAESEWHHPDLYTAWGKVKVLLWTHKINGLSESDFVFAAKVDRLCRG
jgi:4a-hydroxytetrahydrobiopterin dehydratase